MPFWYNGNIRSCNLFKPKWYKHDIAGTFDLISDYIILSKEAIEVLHDFSDINFLDYYQVKADVNNILRAIVLNK